MKILILIKKNSEYGSSNKGTIKSGLYNSARFVKDALNTIADVECLLDFCIDGNDIDNKLKIINPDIVIIEAIWVTPEKIHELTELHPEVKFIIRIHSKVPFLAMEGIAFEWIKKYQKIPNTLISFNNEMTSHDMNLIGINNFYLPNIYRETTLKVTAGKSKKQSSKKKPDKELYKIGCFGAIRPFKNHLNQAVAAILFAESKNASALFFVNASRLEQSGENVLKNLRALFKHTQHSLIEVLWQSHEDFLNLISDMDVCLQVSYTESFNLVTADCIFQKIPIVVSKEISWIQTIVSDPNSAMEISKSIDRAIDNSAIVTDQNLGHLIKYNKKAIDVWRLFLGE